MIRALFSFRGTIPFTRGTIPSASARTPAGDRPDAAINERVDGRVCHSGLGRAAGHHAFVRGHRMRRTRARAAFVREDQLHGSAAAQQGVLVLFADVAHATADTRRYANLQAPPC
jgi:hypothetical protein